MDAGNSLLETSKRIKVNSPNTAVTAVTPQSRFDCLWFQAKSGGHTKMWVYRNLVWAPSWFKDVREKLEDPAFAGFFVPFKRSPPWKNQKCSDLGAGKVCSEHFHAQFQSPLPHNSTARPSDKAQAGVCDAMGCDCGSVPCAWYLFDHRNATLRKWIAEKFLLSPSGLMDDAVDGYFLDDTWDPKRGPANEGPGAKSWQTDTGLTESDAADLYVGWRATMDAANAAVVENGGYTWQMLYNNSTTAQAPFNGHQECAAYMRKACVEPSPLAKLALMYGFTMDRTTHHNIQDLQQHLAAFLLIRGPYAWLGYSWLGFTGLGCAPYVKEQARPRELDRDYGEPLGTCKETAPGTGIFEREWSKASVQLDCGAWKGTVTLK